MIKNKNNVSYSTINVNLSSRVNPYVPKNGKLRQKDNAASGEAEAPAPFEKLTGSVGGRWERPPEGVEADTHKPVVSTWGVFERPKDISKAYGGGRDPTLRKVDAEEKKRRDEETQAILRRLVGCIDYSTTLYGVQQHCSLDGTTTPVPEYQHTNPGCNKLCTVLFCVYGKKIFFCSLQTPGGTIPFIA